MLPEAAAPGPEAETGKMNPNVRASLIYSLVISLSETSWGYTALSGYLSAVGGSNAAVGLAEGFQGLAQLMFALVAGFVADRRGRQLPIRAGALVGAVAVCSIWLGIFVSMSERAEFWACALGLFLWGAYRGVTLAPIDALFADSVETRDRPRLTTLKYVCTILGASLGPLLSMGLFAYWGDTWTLPELRRVIAVGTGLSLVGLVTLFSFRDECALSERASAPLPETDADTALATRIRRSCFLSDVLGGVASGMTVRFFPLFFRDEVQLSPAEVNAVTIATTVLMAVASYSLQALSRTAGRMPVILACKFVGVALLFIMAGSRGTWQTKAFIVPVYVVRTVLMNSTTPLHKSILMDNTPRSRRGRWSAADSITAFGWSGSALIGGLVADQHGFGATFYATAALQSVGTLVLATLLPVVKDAPAGPPHKPLLAAGTADASAAANGAAASATEPLLGRREQEEQLVDAEAAVTAAEEVERGEAA